MKRLLILACLSLALPAAAGTSVFTAAKPIRQDLGNVRLAGDFNHDGRSDILNVEWGKGFAVSLANGSGDFLPPVRTTVAGTPVSSNGFFAAGDVNGDGNLDVAMRGNTLTTAIVLLGNGDGSFTIAVTLTSTPRLGALAFGDFTGDGNADLIAGTDDSGSPGWLFVYPGNGSGSFGSAIATASGASTVQQIVPADLDHDGKLDVTVSESRQTASVWTMKGSGSGTFSGKTAVALTAGELALADFNGDSHLDAVSTGAIVFGNGDGTFHAGGTFAAPAVTGTARTADMNGDGKPDVVVMSSGRIGVLLSHGDGTFDAALWYVGGNSSVAPYLADFDGNGTIDVLDDSPALTIGNGDGTLRAARAFPLQPAAPLFQWATAAGDMTGDGKTDALVFTKATGSNEYSSTVFPGLGNGAFGAPIVAPTGINVFGFDSWGGADCNGDGQLDFVFFSDGADKFYVHLSNHDGTFHRVGDGVAFTGKARALADYDGDGDIDVLEQQFDKLYLHRGNGDGTFSAPVVSNVGISTFDIATGDFNGDGKLDLIDLSGSVFFGSASGVFVRGVNSGTASIPGAAGDFDGDGKADVIWPSGSGILMGHGNGDGTFGAYTFVETIGLDLNGMAAVDADGDGDLDLVAHDAILFGDGHGTFDNYELYPRYGTARGHAVADLDGNGSLDLIVVSDNSVDALLTRTGNVPPLQPQPGLEVTPSPTSEFGQTVTAAVRADSTSLFDVTGVMRVDFGATTIGLSVAGPFSLLVLLSSYLEAHGTVVIKATYLPNNVFAETSLTRQQTVAMGSTLIAVSGGGPPVPYPTSLHFNSQLYARNGHGPTAPTGTMTLREGATVLETWAPTDFSPHHATVPAPAIGTHTYTFEYSGDANFSPSSTPVEQVVTKPFAVIGLSSSPQKPVVGTTLTITATLGTSTPDATGTITLTEGGAMLGTITLGGSPFTSSTMKIGFHSISAAYSGDAKYIASTQPLTLFIYVPFGPPPVTATGYSDFAEVYVNWPPVIDAKTYDVYRSTSGGPFALIGSTTGLDYTDHGRTPWTMYLHRLVARDANGNASAPGAPDPAMIATFADEPLAAGGTLVKAQHFQELRSAVNLLRQAAGLPAFSFSVAPVAGSVVNAAALLELRSALKAARDALGIPTVFGDASPAGALIRAAQLQELREQVR